MKQISAQYSIFFIFYHPYTFFCSLNKVLKPFIYILENFVSTISKICWVETINNYASIIRFSVVINYFWQFIYVK
jgi:hypothetical protein